MNVAELIAELSKLPPDLPVYVRGYEGGVNDVESAQLAHFIRDADDGYCWGQHERVSDRSPNGVELTGENRLAEAANATERPEEPFTFKIEVADPDQPHLEVGD